MATPATNEKRLDEAQKLIRQVLKDVRYNLSDYRLTDVYGLELAEQALGLVTLRQDLGD